MLEQYRKYFNDPKIRMVGEQMIQTMNQLKSIPDIPQFSDKRAALLSQFASLQMTIQRLIANYDENKLQAQSVKSEDIAKVEAVKEFVETSRTQRKNVQKSLLILGGALVGLGLATFLTIKLIKKYKKK